MSTRHSRPLAGVRSVAVLGAVAASLLLTACGGSTPNSTASADQNRERQLLRLTKCLREHGIDVATPTAGGPVKVQGKGNITPQRFEAAQNACKKYAPADRQKLTPQERVESEEAVRKFAKCMREHGIDVEAKTSDGGATIRVGRSEGGPNPESPAFQAAQKACQSYMPKPPGGGKSGGPGGGPSTSKSGGGRGGPTLGFQAGG
jgi:hypothetical protein